MPEKKSVQPSSRQYISIEDTAELLGMNPKTVRVYIAEGRLPGYRVGPRFIRLKLADVEALIQPIPTVQRGRAS